MAGIRAGLLALSVLLVAGAVAGSGATGSPVGESIAADGVDRTATGAAGPVPGTVVGSFGGTDGPVSRSPAPPTDATVTRIRLHENGSATWTVEIRTLIVNETDLRDYRRFQDRFREDPERYLGSFRDRMTRLVERAGNVTDRRMHAANFRASTRVEEGPRQWGVVSYRFRWEGFAADRDGALVVGDVFQSGYYLTDGDSLVVEPPEDHAIASASPPPDSEDDAIVRWVGPKDFGDGRPRVRAVERSNESPGSTTAGGTDGSTSTHRAGESGGAGLPFVPLVVGLAVLVGGVGVYRLVREDDPAAVGVTAGDAGETDPDAGPGDRRARTGDPSPPDRSSNPEEIPGEEPLTNEEQALALLEREGGRMRQADVVEALDWSPAKTSRVLSSMAESGEIEKLRLGNENLIELPGDEDD